MATGRDTQLTRQIGEHMVVAELGRRGLIASPFAGNVPEFDILAADDQGRAIAIQVKAIRGPSWQFSAARFLDIEVIEGVQHIRGAKSLVHPDLLCIFVLVGPEARQDEFFLFRQRDLQDIIASTYRGGIRPKNPHSMHCAVWPRQLESHRDAWHVLGEALESAVWSPHGPQ